MGIRYLQQPLENGNRVIGIPQESVNIRHCILFVGALDWIFGSGMQGHSFLSFRNGRGRFAQTCISAAQKGMRFARGKRIRRRFLELTLEILCRVLISSARRGDIAGPLLTQTKKKFFDVACVTVGLGDKCF